MNPSLEQPRSITRILRTLGQSADRDARARRRFVRRPVNVRVTVDGTLTAEAWALNLSAGGIRVVCEESLAVGEMVRLRIEADAHGLELAGHGRVVWVKGCPDGYVCGIEFLDPL